MKYGVHLFSFKRSINCIHNEEIQALTGIMLVTRSYYKLQVLSHDWGSGLGMVRTDQFIAVTDELA